MEINPNFLAPCGLYCGVCAILYATRENNVKFKERLVGLYKDRLPEGHTLTCGGYPLQGMSVRGAFHVLQEM